MVIETKKEEKIETSAQEFPDKTAGETSEVGQIEKQNAEAFTAKPAAEAVEPELHPSVIESGVKATHPSSDIGNVHEDIREAGGQVVGPDVPIQDLGQKSVDEKILPFKTTGVKAVRKTPTSGAANELASEQRAGLLVKMGTIAARYASKLIGGRNVAESSKLIHAEDKFGQTLNPSKTQEPEAA
jgi:hypothetical protein